MIRGSTPDQVNLDYLFGELGGSDQVTNLRDKKAALPARLRHGGVRTVPREHPSDRPNIPGAAASGRTSRFGGKGGKVRNRRSSGSPGCGILLPVMPP